MYVQQADLTRGVGKDFVKELTTLSIKTSYDGGVLLFRKGDPAVHAYLLLMGLVQLKMGESGNVVHTVKRPGETFGWSSLVGRETYSTTAECLKPTTLRKLHVDDLKKLLKKDPENGLIFFQRLAGMLGERLLQSYARFEKLFHGETIV
jgi:CRP-like cAMP-binding protein